MVPRLGESYQDLWKKTSLIRFPKQYQMEYSNNTQFNKEDNMQSFSNTICNSNSEKKFDQKNETKRFDGCFNNDLIDSIGWGVFFIWAAIVLFFESSGYALSISWWWDSWGVLFTGAGIIALVEAIARIFNPEYSHGIIRNLICGLFFLSIGLGEKVVWIWPLLLIFIGFSILRKILISK